MSVQLIFQQQFEQRLAAFIAAQPRRVDRIVYEVTSDVKTDIQEGWPVDSGVSRAAWDGPTHVGQAHYQLSNPLSYAVVLEYGLYKSPGEKTVAAGGETLEGGISINEGVYSAQKPSAPVRRALAKHHNDIPQRIAADMQKEWGK